MIRMIFFDLGWTLLKPAGPGWLYNPLLLQMFPDISEETLSTEKWKTSAADAYSPFIQNPYMKDTAEQKIRFADYYYELLNHAGFPCSHRQAALLAEDLCENTDNMVLLEGTEEPLRTLKQRGYRMAVISDTWPYIEKYLYALGIDHYFEHFTYSCRLGTTKPSPMMFQDALDACGIPPRECLFIDDRGENLEAAERFHINAVQSCADPDLKKDPHFPEVTLPPDLLKLLP